MSNNNITINEKGIFFNKISSLISNNKQIISFPEKGSDDLIGIGVSNATTKLHLSGGDLLITKLESKYPTRYTVSSIISFSGRIFNVSEHYSISNNLFEKILDLSNISIKGENSISGNFNKIDTTYQRKQTVLENFRDFFHLSVSSFHYNSNENETNYRENGPFKFVSLSQSVFDLSGKFLNRLIFDKHYSNISNILVTGDSIKSLSGRLYDLSNNFLTISSFLFWDRKSILLANQLGLGTSTGESDNIGSRLRTLWQYTVSGYLKDDEGLLYEFRDKIADTNYPTYDFNLLVNDISRNYLNKSWINDISSLNFDIEQISGNLKTVSNYVFDISNNFSISGKKNWDKINLIQKNISGIQDNLIDLSKNIWDISAWSKNKSNELYILNNDIYIGTTPINYENINQLTSNNILFISGNLGINTKKNQGLTIQNSKYPNNYLSIFNSNNNIIFSVSNSHHSKINNDKIVFTENSGFGIGILTPSGTLHISGGDIFITTTSISEHFIVKQNIETLSSHLFDISGRFTTSADADFIFGDISRHIFNVSKLFTNKYISIKDSIFTSHTDNKYDNKSISGRIWDISKTYAISGETWNHIDTLHNITINYGINSMSGILFDISNYYVNSGSIFSKIDDLSNNICFNIRRDLDNIKKIYTISNDLWAQINSIYNITLSGGKDINDKEISNTFENLLIDISNHYTTSGTVFNKIRNLNYELLDTNNNDSLKFIINDISKSLFDVSSYINLSGESYTLIENTIDNINLISGNILDLSKKLFDISNYFTISSYVYNDIRTLYNISVSNDYDLAYHIETISQNMFKFPLESYNIVPKTYIDISKGITISGTIKVINPNNTVGIGVIETLGILHVSDVVGTDNTTCSGIIIQANFNREHDNYSWKDVDKKLSVSNSYYYSIEDKNQFTTTKYNFKETNKHKVVKYARDGYPSYNSYDDKISVSSFTIPIFSNKDDNVTLKELRIHNKSISGGAIYFNLLYDNISQVSAGKEHSLLLTNQGTVYATGYNSFGQLGMGNNGANTDLNSFHFVSGGGIPPVTIGNPNSWPEWQGKVIQVEASRFGEYSFIVTKDGYTYATGYNNEGQLGMGNYGDNTDLNSFHFVSGGNLSEWQGKVKQISCGLEHTLLVTNDNYLYVNGKTGNNRSGMDNDPRPNLTVFTKCRDNNFQGIVEKISAGNTHSMLVTTNKNVFGTGTQYVIGFEESEKEKFTKIINDNYNFQGKVKQVSSGVNHTMLVTTDGDIYVTGTDDTTGLQGIGYETEGNFTICQTTVSGRVNHVSCNSDHSLLVTNDNYIYATGENTPDNGYKLGRSDTNDSFKICNNSSDIQGKVKQVSAGSDHSMILLNDGRLYATGSKENGRTGFNSHLNTFTSIPSNNIQNKIYTNFFDTAKLSLGLEKKKTYKINPYTDTTPNNNFYSILLRPVSGLYSDTNGNIQTLDIYSKTESYVSGYYN